MSTFSESNFAKKLSDLNNSQQSIQTLSLWLIHHRKHSKVIVETWVKELKKAHSSRKLTFLYLANDVIQNSKKKGPEFHRDFKSVLCDAYRHTFNREVDPKMKGSMERMLTIWGERGVFDMDFIERIKKSIRKNQPSQAPVAPREPKPKKPSSKGSDEVAKKKAKQGKKRKVELSLREEIELEIKQGRLAHSVNARDLAKALNDLENSASSDASVRERIAALPPEVSDVSRLEKITDKEGADQLTKSVDEACSLLADYNGRLAQELQERRRVARMLREFILEQKDQLAESEKTLSEHKTKLEKVDTVRKELKSHIQSLPDLTLLPDVTGGLAPLPSAGDLFSLERDAAS